MTGIVNDLRAVVDACRGIMGELGFREHSVTLVRTVWTGERPGLGQPQETERTPITVGNGQNPKVKFPSQRDIALNMMSLGTIEIGPVTPEFFNLIGAHLGGIVEGLTDRTTFQKGETLHIEVRGPQHPNGAKYKIENTDSNRALRRIIRCSQVTGR